MTAFFKPVFTVSAIWTQLENGDATANVINQLKGSLMVDPTVEVLLARAGENRFVSRTRFALVEAHAPGQNPDAVVDYSMLSGFAGKSRLTLPTITDGLATIGKFNELYPRARLVICHTPVRMKDAGGVKRKHQLIYSSLHGKPSLGLISLGNLPQQCRFLYSQP